MNFDLPPVVRALLLSNVLVFGAQALLGGIGFLSFALWPLGEHLIGYDRGAPVSVGFLPWQLVTYGFLHGSLPHLFFNMFALAMFGSMLERVWGSRRFAMYYVVCLVGAALVQLVVAGLAVAAGQDAYPTVGASGGVFGLLLAYGLLFPEHRIMLLIPPVPIRARTFAIGYGVVELVLGLTRTQSGIAHFAHLGGMAFGFLLLQYWRGRWPFARHRKR